MHKYCKNNYNRRAGKRASVYSFVKLYTWISNLYFQQNKFKQVSFKCKEQNPKALKESTDE